MDDSLSGPGASAVFPIPLLAVDVHLEPNVAAVAGKATGNTCATHQLSRSPSRRNENK